MLHFRMIVVFIFLIFTFASQTGFPVFAEQPKTVKECLEHPDKCKDDTHLNEQEMTSNGNTTGNPFSAWDVFKMILATIFVIALIYALLKFINQRGRFSSARRGIIVNLGGTSVGTNRSVQLIKIGNRILVIGVAESVQLLKEIDDEEEIKEILAEYNAKLQQMIEPNKWLQILFANLSNKKNETMKHESFGQMLSKQLKELSDKRDKLLKDLEKKGTTSDE